MDDRIRTESDFGAAIRRDGMGDPSGLGVAPWPGIEQSVASVALGGVFALMAFPAMLMIHVLGDVRFRGWPRALIVVAAALGTLSALFVLTSAVFGLIFGILGMGAARRASRSIALGFAGILLNSLDLLMWLGALVGWIGTVADVL